MASKEEQAVVQVRQAVDTLLKHMSETEVRKIVESELNSKRA